MAQNLNVAHSQNKLGLGKFEIAYNLLSIKIKHLMIKLSQLNIPDYCQKLEFNVNKFIKTIVLCCPEDKNVKSIAKTI